MSEIRLSPEITLPLEAATRRMAILAMSGAGKSNLAVVLAEEMFAAGVPWVAIDPKGDWYGVRSGKDGKSPGLPVPVFGGLHADVPLEPTAGKLMAELVVSHRLTCVLDVSEFHSREDQFRFLHDFAETLLRKNDQPLHLFLEEADEYLPQVARDKGSLPKCLGSWQRLVKRGRFRGIGSTIITQRSAAINKDVLNMAECLFALRVAAPQDRKAILGWVEMHGMGREIVDSLPSLADGEAWVWSPAWLRITQRTQFRRRTTFDSGKTPEIGKSIEPARLAQIDLSAIKDQIAGTMERAKADDPKELRKRIAELEKALRTAGTPVVDQDAIATAVEEATTPLIQKIDSHEWVFQEIGEIAQRLATLCQEHLEVATLVRKHRGKSPADDFAPYDVSKKGAAIEVPPGMKQVIADSRRRQEGGASAHQARISAPQQRILDVLASFEALGMTQVEKGLLAIFADASPKSGSYANNLGHLRNQCGCIEYPGPGTVRLTPAGRVWAAPVDTPLTLSAYRDAWFSRVSNPQRRILEHLIAIYPAHCAKDELAEAVEASATSGSFANNLGFLRNSLGLIEYPSTGYVAASPRLFPEGLR